MEPPGQRAGPFPSRYIGWGGPVLGPGRKASRFPRAIKRQIGGCGMGLGRCGDCQSWELPLLTYAIVAAAVAPMANAEVSRCLQAMCQHCRTTDVRGGPPIQRPATFHRTNRIKFRRRALSGSSAWNEYCGPWFAPPHSSRTRAPAQTFNSYGLGFGRPCPSAHRPDVSEPLTRRLRKSMSVWRIRRMSAVSKS